MMLSNFLHGFLGLCMEEWFPFFNDLPVFNYLKLLHSSKLHLNNLKRVSAEKNRDKVKAR